MRTREKQKEFFKENRREFEHNKKKKKFVSEYRSTTNKFHIVLNIKNERVHIQDTSQKRPKMKSISIKMVAFSNEGN